MTLSFYFFQPPSKASAFAPLLNCSRFDASPANRVSARHTPRRAGDGGQPWRARCRQSPPVESAEPDARVSKVGTLLNSRPRQCSSMFGELIQEREKKKRNCCQEKKKMRKKHPAYFTFLLYKFLTCSGGCVYLCSREKEDSCPSPLSSLPLFPT